MKTTIIAVSDDGTTKVLAHFEGGPVTSLAEARLLSTSSTPRKKVTNSKRVQIVAIDSSNTDVARHLKSGDIFGSAKELSVILGYAYPKVSQALKAAQAAHEDTAVIDGVEVRYVD